MNIQNGDTSRSDPGFRVDGQNLEISAKIRIISNSYPNSPSPNVKIGSRCQHVAYCTCYYLEYRI